MATSPLFGWEEPDDVDLVKDGAAAIRTLGNAIDTSMGDLLGGTSGQVLSKNSNTNMDFTWVTPDDANAIQNAIVDAKGDLIAATAADTPARLAVGTNGQVLTADSTAATGIKWASPASGGGMTLISTTTLTGASVTLSSIPSGYVNLVLTVKKATNSTADGFFAIEPNALGATGYNWTSSLVAGVAYADNSTRVRTPVVQGRTNDANAITTTFYNHEQNDWTAWSMVGGFLLASASDYKGLNNAGYSYVPSSAITSLKILNTGGNWAGGTAYLYGVK